MMKVSSDMVALLNEQAADQSALERIQALRTAILGPVVFTTSFGIEDQAITHIIATAGIKIAFATLDTGRMFPQTYEVWAQTEALFGIKVQSFSPQTSAVEALTAAQGVNGFYGSMGARKACCETRKLEPLERALSGAQGWVTGLRADQSDHRQALSFVSFDEERGLVKLNPIFDWTRADAVAFTKANNVPVNSLHAQGFLSIGCAPCTRAVAEGEPERAGRWWWESEAKKECGLHLGPDGRLSRAGVPA
ncbi:phosphoadenylyl-sulfate reductase [Candidatus Raskinella chloraquaticus]|jgi:phosphoadenosine phosphosulfate reductase|uniref:phosphoadenylyl-sulfate reductase n=2 Tax=Candidatus Raskinella chloraquaticus TaxID=1951219 RepID=UPI00366B00B7